MVEYALILVLVAIVVIAALMILGPIIGGVFSKINGSLSGIGGGSGGGSEAVAAPGSCSAAAAKWQATVGVTQDAMNAEGWPSSGPTYDAWQAASNEWLNSPERAYFISNSC